MQFAKTGDQIRWAYQLLFKLEKFPKTGAVLLLASGIGIMWMSNTGFQHGWLNVSLGLFVLLEILAIGIVPRKMKRIAECVLASTGERIPDGYENLVKEARPYLMSVHLLAALILVLMISKPF
ncbi:DUF2269 family protein [Effusibacillus lacus]|uniref:DUF2269 domain-containing protein n=1 Tax=Effusibacillus lacus TaxID=1348429 RepID=A0A292YQG6_9BACL|nr:DUF2269 family protein [Effusibacillus lacus]TCS76818.1 putative integral membrane protein DUF2269 [Effusibacillus lacus]GAX91149.1 hypothetical protein EFBL_2815 [Effusibacillus lacus]